MTDPSPLDPAQLLDADGRLAVDLSCLNCGYNLRSQEAVGACPECGQGVAESLRPDLLWFAPIAWLKSLLGGTRFLLIGAGLFPLLTCCGPFLRLFGFFGVIGIMSPIAWCLPVILVSIGAFRISRVGPREAGDPLTWGPRLASGVLIVALLGLAAMAVSNGSDGPAFVLLYLVQFALSALALSIMFRMSRLATRLPWPKLARGVRVLGVLLGTVGVLATVCVAIAMFLAWMDLREEGPIIAFAVAGAGLWGVFALLGLAAVALLGLFHDRLRKVVRSAQSLRRRLEPAGASIDPDLTPPGLPP